MKPLSNLFIVGAPKCGTSSLFNQLTLHPEIIGTNPKETFALLSPEHPLSKSRQHCSMGALQKLVPLTTSGETQPILLEGTTHHLYSEHAARAIAEIGDQARVVVLLRNPAKRILSSFQYTQQNLARIPKSLNFGRYVDLLLEDRQAAIREQIPHPVSGAVLSMDLGYSDYGKFLKQWFDLVGKEKVFVAVAEEYFQNPATTLKEIYRWLGLSDPLIDSQNLKRRNETRTIASPVFHQIAYQLNRLFPGSRILKPVKKVYFQVQSLLSTKKCEDLSGPMKKLERYFEPKINDLSALLDRDFTIWKQRGDRG